MKLEHFNEIKGIIILALSLILLASLASFNSQDLSWYTSKPNLHPQNWIGPFGAYFAGVFFFLVGVSSYFLVGIGLFWSWNKFTSREIRFNFFKFISLLMLFVVSSSLLALIGDQVEAQRFLRGGLVGIVFSNFLESYFSPVGAFIILFAFGALSLVVTGEFLVSPFFIWLFRLATSGTMGVLSKAKELPKIAPSFKSTVKANVKDRKAPVNEVDDEEEDGQEKKIAAKIQKDNRVVVPPVIVPKAEAKPQAPNIHIVATKETPKVVEQTPKIVGEYHLPSLDLLNDSPVISSDKIQDDLKLGAKMLEETLNDFGISVKVADIERGPVITRYELQPAPGVKVGSILNLSDDIALAMRAPAVRIVAPIPGKNRVGIEVPNGSTAAVYLKDVLVQSEYRSNSSKLMIAIGKDISGKPLIGDLAEMPHLLIAGTTGSGKTVCLNSLITSLLYNASPSELKMIMIDPKMVEMSDYNDLPHLICPVVTDAKKATAAFNWVVGEMESRYRTFNKEQVRNIKGYHAKGLQMPYIVIIVDELADLMQVAAKTIEGSIARIAQLARAAGIHLILATQRPSVNVITGVIKANFPSRISFKVASQIDSRTVLDMKGSESLLGKGDLLFIRPGEAKPIRGQCCFVSDEEIKRVIAHIKKQATPEYNETVLKPQVSSAAGNGAGEDEMYDEAVRVVVETNQASVSVLQRRLRLGYSRAARLIDIMEQNGIVGPYAGSKARDILVDREKWLVENMGQPKNDANNPKNNNPSSSLLKDTRLSKGLTLEIVHEATKIPMDALRAIEEGYSTRILTPFYYRGFIKIYAEFLGLNVADVLKEYNAQPVESKLPIKTVVVKSASAKPMVKRAPSVPKSPVHTPNIFLDQLQEFVKVYWTPRNRKNLLRIIGVIVAIFILVKIVGCVAGAIKNRPKNSSKTVVLSKETKKQHVIKHEQPKEETAAKEEVQEPKVIPVVSTNHKVTLTVHANKDSYIQVKSDGKVVFGMTMKKGTVENWEAGNQIELSGRNLGDLDLEVNGKEVDSLGSVNRRAKRIVITKEGLSVKK